MWVYSYHRSIVELSITDSGNSTCPTIYQWPNSGSIENRAPFLPHVFTVGYFFYNICRQLQLLWVHDWKSCIMSRKWHFTDHTMCSLLWVWPFLLFYFTSHFIYMLLLLFCKTTAFFLQGSQNPRVSDINVIFLAEHSTFTYFQLLEQLHVSVFTTFCY